MLGFTTTRVSMRLLVFGVLGVLFGIVSAQLAGAETIIIENHLVPSNSHNGNYPAIPAPNAPQIFTVTGTNGCLPGPVTASIGAFDGNGVGTAALNDLPGLNAVGQRCEYRVSQQANDCWMYGDYIYVDGRRTGSPFQISLGTPVTVVWENIPSCMALTVVASTASNDRPTGSFTVNISGRINGGSSAQCAQYDGIQLGANDSTTVYLNTGPLDTPCRYLVEESVPDGWTIDGPARLEFMPLGADKIKTAQFMNRFSGSPAVTASSTPNTTAPRVTATSKPVPRTTAPPVETTQPEEPTVAPTSPPRTAPQSTGPAKTAPPATQSSAVSTTEPVQTTTAEVTLVDVSTTTAAAAAPTSTAATRDSQAVAPSADSSNSINGGLVALGAAGAAALFGSLIIGWRRRNADDELDSDLYDGDLYE